MLITVFNELSLFGAVVAREHDVSPGNNGVSFEEDWLSAIDHLCARNQLPKRSKYCIPFFKKGRIKSFKSSKYEENRIDL